MKLGNRVRGLCVESAMRAFFVMILTAMSLTLFSSPPACACKCAPMAESDAVAKVDVVVKAEVVKVTKVDKQTREVTLKVKDAIKGNPGAEVVFTTNESSASCGVEAPEGETKTFYLRGGVDELTAAACDQAVYADEIAQNTVPDSVPDAGKAPKLDVKPESPARGWAYAGGALVLGGLGVLAWALRRRAS